MRKLLLWVARIGGGMVGNAVASAFLIRGEGEGDTVGFVQETAGAFGPDDGVRVSAVLAGAAGADMVAKKLLGTFMKG